MVELHQVQWKEFGHGCTVAAVLLPLPLVVADSRMQVHHTRAHESHEMDTAQKADLEADRTFELGATVARSCQGCLL